MIRNPFQRFARAVEELEHGLPARELEQASVRRLVRAVDSLHCAEAAEAEENNTEPNPLAGSWVDGRHEQQLAELRHQLAVRDRLIDQLGGHLGDALTAHPVPYSDAMPMPETPSGLAHELAKVRADRDRLEAVNDELREQLRKARLMLAARTGTAADELLVPWEQRTGPDGIAR